MANISLTDDQIHMLDQWHAIEKDNIPTLLHCICKVALIHHVDDQYHLSKQEAKSLLTLSDVLLHLAST